MTDLDTILGARDAGAPVLVLTGAGISAESGIPTFRGKDGYWQVGSVNYQAQELATRAAFERIPDEIWGWYLYRRAVCRAARPNEAHDALASIETTLGDRFRLVTQNVDGLHLRAGNTLDRTWQIHGNIEYLRCWKECDGAIRPVPEAVGDTWAKGRLPGKRERELLACPSCGGLSRPHVLWFDEAYDEPRYRFHSALAAAGDCGLLVVVGTSGATNLPTQICRVVAGREAPMIVIGPEETPFSEMAESNPQGLFLRGTAVEHVPVLAARLG